ncbi:hypothetical protein HK098_006127 [Nowakowskiella sp. JEL0407]|nr:hypothetical protein HK098_006127 [Nowakowskiella sp. JEL0407]
MDGPGLPRGMTRNFPFTHQRSKSSPHALLSDRDYELATYAAALQLSQQQQFDDPLFRAFHMQQSLDASALAYQEALLLNDLALRQGLSGYPHLLNSDPAQLGSRALLQPEFISGTGGMLGYGINPGRPTHDRKRTQSSDAALASLLPGRSHFKDDQSATSIHDEDGNLRTDREMKKVNLYKTELCRSWEETGYCRYGAKCQFAHSEAELRYVDRHPKYKTEMCKTFWEKGTCPYGKRCCFIHTDKNAEKKISGLGDLKNDNAPPRADPPNHHRSKSLGSREMLHPLAEESDQINHFGNFLDIAIGTSQNGSSFYSDQPYGRLPSSAPQTSEDFLLGNNYVDQDVHDLGKLFKNVSISPNGVVTPISPTQSPSRFNFPEMAVSPPGTSTFGGRSFGYSEQYDSAIDSRHRRHKSISQPKTHMLSPSRQNSISHTDTYSAFGTQQIVSEQIPIDSGFSNFGSPLSPSNLGMSAPNGSTLSLSATPPAAYSQINIEGSLPVPERQYKDEFSRPQFLKSM